jgi:hypothetical protein
MTTVRIKGLKTWVIAVEIRFQDGTVITDQAETAAKDITDLQSKNFEEGFNKDALWATLDERYSEADVTSLRIETYLKGSR